MHSTNSQCHIEGICFHVEQPGRIGSDTTLLTGTGKLADAIFTHTTAFDVNNRIQFTVGPLDLLF
jgi:hypothetical protein